MVTRRGGVWDPEGGERCGNRLGAFLQTKFNAAIPPSLPSCAPSHSPPPLPTPPVRPIPARGPPAPLPLAIGETESFPEAA
jgi:hypothetical protein